MDANRARELVAGFARKRVLVVGDIILDEFIWGNVTRISPEAPVPVVDVTSESVRPGGAANVALNLREFTAEVAVLGRTGTDRQGEQLRALLESAGVDTRGLMTDGAAPTGVKTRIIARHQQVVRIDREKRLRLSGASLRTALDLLGRLVTGVDAIIVADYNKGFITPEIAHGLCRLGREKGVLLAVDPHPANLHDWAGAAVVKPNYAEAFAAAGRPYEPLQVLDRRSAILEVGELLLHKWGSSLVLVTLGEHGMLLFREGAQPFHIPTVAREVFDVSGAGDTAISLLTLALAGGAAPEEAAELANHASGVVVGKLGTATVNAQELLESFDE